jgi:Lipid desaturase domain
MASTAKLDGPPKAESGRTARRLEGVAIAAATALWLALLGRFVATAEWSAALVCAVLPACAAGVFTADLLSGVMHFVCDRFFSERTPVIGRALIAPFHDHHRDPAGIARHGFCERNGNNCIALLPVLIAAHACFDVEPVRLGASALQAWLLAFCAGAAVTNEIHAWAHGARAPAFAGRLQRAGLILSPQAHQRHHEGGHARAYCITTGWCNRVLDELAAFAALEAAIRRAGRALRSRHAP